MYLYAPFFFHSFMFINNNISIEMKVIITTTTTAEFNRDRTQCVKAIKIEIKVEPQIHFSCQRTFIFSQTDNRKSIYQINRKCSVHSTASKKYIS